MKGVYINKKSNTSNRKIYTESWNVEELDDFFREQQLPETMRLNAWTMIINVKIFIARHIEFARANNGNALYMPYLERLQQVKNMITATSKEYQSIKR